MSRGNHDGLAKWNAILPVFCYGWKSHIKAVECHALVFRQGVMYDIGHVLKVLRAVVGLVHDVALL